MKKLSFALISVSIIVLVTISSCHLGCIRGSGNLSTETRKTGPFVKISAEGGFKLKLIQDSSYNITVSADDNLQKYIHTTVTGNMLRIYSRKNFCNSLPITIVVGIGNLELLRNSGAVEVTNDGKLNVHDLKLDLAGANNVTLNLAAANLVTDGSGSTELHLTGQAASHKLSLTGSGKVDAFNFITGDYDVTTTGAADVEINVLHSLKTNTTGSADIKYKGSPEVIQNEKAGSSNVKKVE